MSKFEFDTLTNSTNSSSLASRVPSPLASPSVPAGGSYKTSFKSKLSYLQQPLSEFASEL